MMALNLAIFSPNHHVYSETFIQAHKKLPFNIKFYYGGTLPTVLENNRGLWELNLKEKIIKKLNKSFTLHEHTLLFSLKREKIDVVLAEYGETAGDTLNVVKSLRLPLLVHYHGYDASIIEVLRRNDAKYKEVFEYSKAVIAVSQKMQMDLIKIGCPDHKVVLNHYGPDPSFFAIRPDYDRQQFVGVGRFIEKKAPHLTILAFREVVRLFPQATLILIGDGPLLTICKQMVNSLELMNNVIFSGPQKTEEIQKVFAKSIAFVQHSITASNGDSEGTPVAVLEAQASGLPVISTCHAGIADVVIHGETGLLVTEGDVNLMADNMMRVLKENGLARTLGNAGRLRVQQHFTLEKHLRILETEIKKAVGI